MAGRRLKTPSYSLDLAKSLVRSGRYGFTKRGRSFVVNHYGRFDLDEICSDIFERMSQDDFYKSEELDARPGTFADIYRGVVYDEVEWYVKFFIDDSGQATVSVWSLCWDGTNH